MKGHIKDYFTFTKSERIGITILLIIVIIILVIPRLIDDHTETSISGDELYKAEVNEFLKGIKSNEKLNSNQGQDSRRNTKSGKQFTPLLFDPNTATQKELEEMGFSEKQAASIIKYRSKGGVFNNKEDFNKLYVVDDETYGIFEPYIRISAASTVSEKLLTEEKISNQSGSGTSDAEKDIELNSADSVELLKIRGVGPVFASRIIKYRRKLGGFTSVEQLQEVYGIDSSRFSQIASQVMTDSIDIIKININTATITELKKHPYLDYYLAKAIIDKRIQKGSYSSVNDLQDIFSKKPGLFEKVAPYFTVLKNKKVN